MKFNNVFIKKYGGMELSLKEINSITFGIYSPEEIIKQSVVKIDSNKLHGENSVYDERMGIL